MSPVVKKKKKRLLPPTPFQWLPTGLAGFGLLSGALARGLASDAEARDVAAAVAAYDPAVQGGSAPMPPGYTGLTYYQKALSPGASLQPFGVPVGRVLAGIRQSARLRESLGVPAGFALTPESVKSVSGYPHYNAFAKGPVSAYLHQLYGRNMRSPIPSEHVTAGEASNYADYMANKLTAFSQSQPRGLSPVDIDLRTMPLNEQDQLLRDFHRSLSPDLQRFREQQEANTHVVTQANNYLAPTKKLLTFRQGLVDSARVAGGAATGAAAGSVLYDLLRNKKRRSGWERFFAGGTGAGLGGLATYLAATDHGRNTARTAVNTLLQRLAPR